MVQEVNLMVSKVDFSKSIGKVIGYADALVHKKQQNKMTIKASFTHHVNYSREERFAEIQEKFTREHRNYRYLVEKLVQLEPSGPDEISDSDLQRVLAFIDWLLVVQSSSDAIHYGVSPAGVTISHDYLIEVVRDENIEEKENGYAYEEAQIRLGTIGEKGDGVELKRPMEEQLAQLDGAFLSDYGFRFTNMIKVLGAFTFWPALSPEIEESAHYFANPEKIKTALLAGLEDFNADELMPILNFLSLQHEEMLSISGDPVPCEDLPIWEHYKRGQRYTLRPLIKDSNVYLWGAHATRQTGLIWTGSVSDGRRPVELQGTHVTALLRTWKAELDLALEDKATEIVRRHTSNVHKGAMLHNLDRTGGHPKELGDYDVLAYIPQAHIILNIECKNLFGPFCMKDAKRLRETIFGRPGKGLGHFDQVNLRQEYLKKDWEKVCEGLNWPLTSPGAPKIISVYLSPTIFWWMRHPPYSVESNFVHVKMLSKFIKDLTSSLA
jgi:hypothetical protein